MILIVGCGILGQYVLRELLQKTDEQIYCTYHGQRPQVRFETGRNVNFLKCDITKKEDLLNLDKACNGEDLVVFYFAAFHNIDAVYRHPQQAFAVNVAGLSSFFGTVKNIKAFYYSSTDCVYGESKPGQAPFKETDECAPVNEYGRQKKEAENIVLKNGFNVFRFSLLYGASLCEKQNFYDKTFLSLQKGESVEMIDGLARNALTYEQAAQTIVKLATGCKNIPQILNIAGDNLLTKYNLGLRIAAEAGAAPELVKPISEAAGQKFFADKRASTIALSNALLNSNLAHYVR